MEENHGKYSRSAHPRAGRHRGGEVPVLQIGCLWKIAVNSVSGFICLWLLNLASGLTGIVLPINFVSCLLTGFLGIPGIILLVLGQLL